MKKIKSLIDQVGKPSVIKRNSEDDVAIHAPSYSNKGEAREYLRNPQADRETIECIDVEFFDVSSNIDRHELEKMPENLTLKDVENRQRKLRLQLNAVSKKLSDVILENQPSYTKELKDVQELQRSLHNAFVICSNGRRFLMSVSVRATSVGLGVLSRQQKKQKLLSLCEALQTIKTLQRTDVRLREMLDEEDYDGAIQLCLECQQVAATYKQYHCIKDLSSKLQDTLDIIEEQIDVALSKTCKSFDGRLYGKLQTSYQLLGKMQSAIDQLLMHYTTAVHNTAFQVVLGYAELSTSSNNLQKKQYKDLCAHIGHDIYIPCLLNLCKALWGIMNCYHKTSKWHAQEFLKNYKEDDEMVDYVNRKLSHGRHRVWADVQSRIRTYILSSDLSQFKYDDFIKVLDVVKRFILIGEDFCYEEHKQSKTQQISDNLNEPLRKQTLSYFHAHHSSKLEEVLMFLNNEVWEPCPVKPSFKVLGMQEFKFLKIADADSSYFDDVSQNESVSHFSGSKYFDPFSGDNHPFSDLEKPTLDDQKVKNHHVRYDSYEASDDDDINDELLQDFVDEKTGDSPISRSSSAYSIPLPHEGPIMTNTALHILRVCGSYMKMCDVLKPIAMDVVMCMSQLFDLYFYAVYQFFSTEEERYQFKYERLTATIQHFEESLFQPLNVDSASENETISKDECVRIKRPALSHMVQLHQSETNFGITERVVATESLICLSEQFKALRKYLEEMIPSTKKAFLHQFYSQTVHSSPDVRLPVYYGVAVHCINFYNTVDQMSSVNWDIRDIMSQHNPYVDHLLGQLTTFKTSLSQSVKTVIMPEAVSRVIWEHCITISNQVFVEGFSNVKKCSNEGRALMQLDYQHFLMKLEKLTNIRPIPSREYVETYIKAYYLTESDLEVWIQSHSEYSDKQLSALVTCSAATYASSSGTSGNRKAKQRMMALIEDLKIRK